MNRTSFIASLGAMFTLTADEYPLPPMPLLLGGAPNPHTTLGKRSRSRYSWDARSAGWAWPGDGVRPAETRQMRRHPR